MLTKTHYFFPPLTKNVVIMYVSFICISCGEIEVKINEGDIPPFGTQFSGGVLDGTHYAKGRYAVRRNYVISFGDINFYFNKVQISSENTTHMTYKVK